MEVANLRNAARTSSQRRKPDIAGEVTPISRRPAPAPFMPVHPLADDDSEWTALIRDLVRSGVEPHHLSTLGCSQLVVDIAAALSGSRLRSPPGSDPSVLRPLSPPISPHGLSTPSAPVPDLGPSHAESIHKDKLLSQKAALALRNQARARSFEHELDSLLFAPVDPSATEEAAPATNPAQNNVTRGVLLSQEEDPLTSSHERPHDNLTTSPTLAVTLGSSTPSGRRTPAQDLFVTAAPAAMVIDLSDSEGESEEIARPTFGGRVRSNPTVEPEHPRSPFLAQSTRIENLVRAEQLAQQEVALLRTKLELAQLQRRKQVARS